MSEINKKPNTDPPQTKFKMYFHTSFRNIGLYTSLSFGALAYSRFHRGKSPLYDAVLIGISMLFLLLSFTINWILNRDINEYLDAHELPDKYSMYLTITKTIFVIHSILFALGAGTFIKSYFLQ